MKLLIYSHFFAPSVGGVETIILSLARGLAGLRDSNGAPQFEITLVTQTPAGNCEDSAFPFRVTRKPGFRHLWRLIRESDAVHVAGPALAPLFLAALSRKPFLVEHHGFQTICPNGQLLIKPSGIPCPGHFRAGHHLECLRCNSAEGWRASQKLWLLTFVRRLLCARAAANIAPTQWLGTLLALPRGVTVYHGVEGKESSLRAAVDSCKPTIVFLGRLVTTKGVGVLFEAARSLHQQGRRFELVVIGDGPERAALEQFARASQLKEQVQFLGQIGGAQLESTLAKASTVVVPSLGGEVFGLVVAENMLRGLAVVVSDLGSLTEVLGDSGLRFRTGNAADLSSVLARLLDDPSLAATLGHRARQRALLLYSVDHMIESHALLYSQFCPLKNR